MARVLAVLVVLSACSGAPRSPWAEARGVAEAHLRARYGEPPAWEIVKELAGTPYAFRVRGTKELVVLVHDHHVLVDKGLAAFDRYVRDSHCLATGAATLEEITLLVQLFDAYPPNRNARGEAAPLDYYRKSIAPAALLPHLDYAGGGRARLTLNYRDRATEDGPTTDDVIVHAWTLTIDPVAPMTWAMQPRTWDPEHKRFVDVDHQQ